jgi:hypothetical protein
MGIILYFSYSKMCILTAMWTYFMLRSVMRNFLVISQILSCHKLDGYLMTIKYGTKLEYLSLEIKLSLSTTP